jgi:hypothetical protein
MTSDVPEEAPQEAIDAFLATFPGEDEAAARAYWAAARRQYIMLAAAGAFEALPSVEEHLAAMHLEPPEEDLKP